MGDFQCPGTTIFDESAQYCNWPESVTCVNTTCPQPAVMPTAMPTVKPSANGGGGGPSTSTDTAATITPESSDCSNPCPPNFTGFQTQPGTSCKKYVQCDNGAVAGELECFGGRIFNSIWQYCDFETSTTCAPAPCPEQSHQSPPSPINAPMTVTPVISEEEKSEDCSNPCPLEYSGLLPKPGTMCKRYIECSKGSVFSEFECFGTQFFHSEKGTCTDLLNGSEETVESLCPPTPCPDPLNPPEEKPEDCSNPCPFEYSGLLPKPDTLCKSYVQCNKGRVYSEFECFGSSFFNSEKGTCADVLNGSEETVESLCPPTSCPEPQPTNSPIRIPNPTTSPSYFNLPLTRRPTPQPVSPADRIPMAAPTKIPTSPTTRKKKAKQKEVLLAIPDSSSLCLRCYYQYFTFSVMSSMFFFI